MYIRILTNNGLKWSLFGKDLLEGVTTSVEVQAIMVNVNYDEEHESHDLLGRCRPLREYSWLVAEVRENQGRYDNLALAIKITIAIATSWSGQTEPTAINPSRKDSSYAIDPLLASSRNGFTNS